MESLLPAIERLLANPNSINIAKATVGIAVIAIIFRTLSRFLSHQIKNADLRYRINKITLFTSYVSMALYVAAVFSNSLARLTVVFGVVGAGVAFALQEVIVSVAGWVAISLGQFYKPGDRVQLGGIMGDVIDVSPLRTTLMECGDWVKADLYNGRIVRIANSFVFKAPVYNYSGDFPFLWDEIRIPIRHGSNHRLARSILQEVVEEVAGKYVKPALGEWSVMTHKFLIENARISPIVTLIITDNWIEYTVRYVVDYKLRRHVRDQLFTLILDRIHQAAPAVELASTTSEIVAVPPLRLTRAADPSPSPPP